MCSLHLRLVRKFFWRLDACLTKTRKKLVGILPIAASRLVVECIINLCHEEHENIPAPLLLALGLNSSNLGLTVKYALLGKFDLKKITGFEIFQVRIIVRRGYGAGITIGRELER